MKGVIASVICMDSTVIMTGKGVSRIFYGVFWLTRIIYFSLKIEVGVLLRLKVEEVGLHG